MGKPPEIYLFSDNPEERGKKGNRRKRGKIPIRQEKGLLDECIDATKEVLDNIPNIYQRDESLVWILPQRSGRGVPRAISESNLKYLLSKYIDYYKVKVTKDGFEDSSIDPPKDVVSSIHSANYWSKIPHLRTITSHPVVSENGSIRSKPGYDPKTQVFSTHKGDLDVKPFSQDEAKHAREQLLELVDEFPFVDISDDVWLGSVLTPLVRPWCGPAPMFIITSSTPSAGKGRLVDISSIISCGGEGVEGATIPPTDEEFQKCHISWGLSCPEIIYFDNVRSGSTISSAVLDMALTKDKVTGRLLGQSKVIKTELFATWMASGNNITTKGDTSRRTLICRIEPLVEHPETRQFRIPDILAHTRKHRKYYLSLACGILSGWLASSSPSPLPPLGSFETWSHAVRGAIIWAGGADIIQALASHSENDDTTSTHRSLLEIWHKCLEKPITSKELLEVCESAENSMYDNKAELADIVAEFCPGRGPVRFGTVNRLSYLLRGVENRVRNINKVKMAIKRVDNSVPIKWIVETLE